MYAIVLALALDNEEAWSKRVLSCVRNKLLYRQC